VLIPKLKYLFIHNCNGKYKPKDIDRFINKINKGNECWEWNGGKSKFGYGRFFILFGLTEKTYYSHRIAYELYTNQLVPEGLCVCHKCDNPSCVNPKHLFIGTTQDNTKDKINKGRQIRGEKIGASSLSYSIINKIRKLYMTGKYTQKQLAIKFFTTQGNVGKIIRNELWIDLTYIPPKSRLGRNATFQCI
jgi:hypothetical protein